MRGLVAWPILINVVLVAGLVTIAAFGFDAQLERWLPASWGWLAWLLWPLFAVAVLFLIAVTAVGVAAILASPFAGPIAYRKARQMGRTPGQPARSFAGECAHGLTTAVRKLGYYALLLIPVLIVSLIPGLNLFAPLAWFIFGSWVLAVEFLEVPLANDGQRFAEVRRSLAAHRMGALAFGSGAVVLAMVPVVNLFIVPAAVIGATEVWARHLQRDVDPGTRDGRIRRPPDAASGAGSGP